MLLGGKITSDIMHSHRIRYYGLLYQCNFFFQHFFFPFSCTTLQSSLLCTLVHTFKGGECKHCTVVRTTEYSRCCLFVCLFVFTQHSKKKNAVLKHFKIVNTQIVHIRPDGHNTLGSCLEEFICCGRHGKSSFGQR